MTINWLQAIIDLPRSHFDSGRDFWLAVTGCSAGEVHPDHDEYLHLVPPSGDMHLELQRIDDGPAGAHLDLLVDDIAATAARATELGATVLSRPGHVVMRSPGGVTFCLVPHNDESERAPLVDDEHAHAVDQICLDIPTAHFDDDVVFWAALTGWDTPPPSGRPEFVDLETSTPMPLRILLQRLGDDHAHGASAHLDISCGQHVEAVTAAHEAAGATVIERFERWTVMSDPAGQRYCLTSRQPYQCG